MLRKWSSVSAAAAALVGLHRADASPGHPSGPEEALGNGRIPLEPLVLGPAPVRVISEQLFAGHRSHASHASHSSGSSGRVPSSHSSHASHASSSTGGGSYYVPPTVAPRVAPTPAVQRIYPPRPATPAATPGQSPPAQLAPSSPTNLSPMRIELTNGAVVYGVVMVKSAAGITVTIAEKRYKIPRI